MQGNAVLSHFTTMNFLEIQISYYYPLFALVWEIKMELKKE